MRVVHSAAPRGIQNWWMPIVGGVLFVAAGAYLFTLSSVGFAASSTILGIVAVGSGLVSTLFAVTNRERIESWGWYLSQGVLDFAFAAMLLTHELFAANILAYFIGFWLVIKGASLVGVAIDIRNHLVENWGWVMGGGIATLTIATVMIASLFSPQASAVVWGALSMISLGIFSAFGGFLFKNTSKAERKEVREPEESPLRRSEDRGAA